MHILRSSLPIPHSDLTGVELAAGEWLLTDAVVPAPRGVIRADLAGPRPIDGGGVSGLACRSPGPARSTSEEAADVPLMCTVAAGSWGGQRLSMGGYVTERGATAAGGRSC